MALNFPTSPSVNDTYVSSGITYTWDGTTWKASSSFNETDPVFTTSPAFGITGSDVSNWNTAYGWGDHSTAGYLTSSSDTLQDVTGRGATSNVSLTLSSTLNVNSELHMGNSTFRIIPNFPSAGTYTLGNISGTGGIVFRCGQSSSISFTNENGTNIFASISSSGGLTAGGLTYPTTNGTSGQVLTSDGSGNVIWDASGSSSSLQSRTTAQATTGSLVDGASTYITIAAAKTYALHKIQTSAAAWVTLYTDTTSRTNDATRNETTDPVPGSGVIAEVITTGAATQKITPGTIGWNDDGTPSSNVYLKVVNKSGSTQTITVTLHYVQLEG